MYVDYKNSFSDSFLQPPRLFLNRKKNVETVKNFWLFMSVISVWLF